MPKQQNYYIYVIAFDSGTLKVGRAADAVARLSTHRREAARHRVGVTAEWHSAPRGEFEAVQYERLLIDFCASRGTLRAGQEYFCGLDYEEVQALAETLAGASVPLAMTKAFPSRRQPGRRTPKPVQRLLDGREYASDSWYLWHSG